MRRGIAAHRKPNRITPSRLSQRSSNFRACARALDTASSNSGIRRSLAAMASTARPAEIASASVSRLRQRVLILNDASQPCMGHQRGAGHRGGCGAVVTSPAWPRGPPVASAENDQQRAAMHERRQRRAERQSAKAERSDQRDARADVETNGGDADGNRHAVAVERIENRRRDPRRRVADQADRVKPQCRRRPPRCRMAETGRARTARGQSASRARSGRSSPERSAPASVPVRATPSGGRPQDPRAPRAVPRPAARPSRSTRRTGQSAGTSAGRRT